MRKKIQVGVTKESDWAKSLLFLLLISRSLNLILCLTLAAYKFLPDETSVTQLNFQVPLIENSLSGLFTTYYNIIFACQGTPGPGLQEVTDLFGLVH